MAAFDNYDPTTYGSVRQATAKPHERHSESRRDIGAADSFYAIRHKAPRYATEALREDDFRRLADGGSDITGRLDETSRLTASPLAIDKASLGIRKTK